MGDLRERADESEEKGELRERADESEEKGERRTENCREKTCNRIVKTRDRRPWAVFSSHPCRSIGSFTPAPFPRPSESPPP